MRSSAVYSITMCETNRMNTNKVSINIEVETYFANYEKLKGVKLCNWGITKSFINKSSRLHYINILNISHSTQASIVKWV